MPHALCPISKKKRGQACRQQPAPSADPSLERRTLKINIILLQVDVNSNEKYFQLIV
jgi:hypothetical protein